MSIKKEFKDSIDIDILAQYDKIEDRNDFTVKIEDLPKIEAEMKKIVKENIAIKRYSLTKEEAKVKFANDKFKCELIDAVEDDVVSIYEQADYADVCRGPHVLSTGQLKNFKLLNVAGAYWRGDSDNEMLTRIYGTCWFTAEDLEKVILEKGYDLLLEKPFAVNEQEMNELVQVARKCEGMDFMFFGRVTFSSAVQFFRKL